MLVCVYSCQNTTLLEITCRGSYQFNSQNKNGQVSARLLHTPTKRSVAQHLVEYEKQLLYEENQKSGNVMQHPMDTYVRGINTSSFSFGHFTLSRDKHFPVEFWYT